MTATTDLVTSEPKIEVSSKSNQLSEGTVKAFINGHLETPKGSHLAIRTVSPCRFYRVNVIKEQLDKYNIWADQKIIDSKFIEVVSLPKGLKLIDRTIRPKLNSVFD